MADKFKKIDKEFQLTDSSVNCYGFRLLTSGYQQGEYEKNPIGYYMHERYSGVLLKWEDFRTEDDAVFAKPVINLNHYRGVQTISEIENGFLNGASVGHLIILEMSDDPGYKVPGQEGPTATKWFNRECSIVDIPGNFGSLSLFDKDENPITLADFTSNHLNKNFLSHMKQTFFTPAQLSAMNLKADADTSAIETAFNDLVAKAKKVDALELENTNLKADNKKAEDDKTAAETKLSALQKTTTGDKVKSLLSDALAAKKITKETSTKLELKYAEDPEGLKDLVDAMPAYQSITNKIEESKDKGGADLAAMTWDELHKRGLLEKLKATNLAAFKEKYSAAHEGKEYKD